MKKTGILFILFAFTGIMLAQEASPADTSKTNPVEAPEAPEAPEVQENPGDVEVDKYFDDIDTTSVMSQVEVLEGDDKTRVTLGKNEVIIVEENGDTVVVALGSKGVSIVEEDDGVKIKVLEMESRKKEHRKKRKRFNPHWAAVELGLNNYLTPDFSLVLPGDQDFMDLNTGKSWNWNLNVVDFGLPLGTSYIGIASGLGFEFINYNFDGQNSIMKDDATGQIVEYVPPYAGFITKSKMNINYVNVPLILEFQIPAGRHNRIYISGGVIGSLKMWSNTKIKYTEAGDKSKEKNKSDFNLSPLRWGFTARAGYENFGVFANYYMTPLFKPGTGPGTPGDPDDLYPFTVGAAITF